MNNRSPLSRGFTLIELLVVISIIALLSSVLLTSLASARAKAQDVTVKRNLSTIRQQAALFQSSNNNTYGGTYTAATCPASGTTMFYTDATIRAAIQAAASASNGTARCATDGSNYAVSVQMRSTPDHWCVDSMGTVKQITNAAWTGVACP